MKAIFSKGLSTLLLSNFPNHNLIEAPVYKPELNLINIHWLCGFINAEGSFYISIRERIQNNKISNSCDICINITQNVISLIVMEEIIKFLGFGSLT